MMNNILGHIYNQIYKITLAAALSAIVWVFIYSSVPIQILNPLDIFFSGASFVFIFIIGIIFNSVLAALFAGVFLFWISLIFLLAYYYDQFSFWKYSFAESTAQILFFHIGIGLLIALVVLIILKIKGIKIFLLDKQIQKLHRSPLLILICLIILVLSIVSPIFVALKYSVTPFDMYANVIKSQISIKTEKILQTSPEQALEFYLSSLEAEDYENAFYAQTPDVSFVETNYYTYVDIAKEEDIQLSKPLSHTAEKEQDNSDEVSFLVTVSRENGSTQDYRFIIVRNLSKWYIKEKVLLKIY